MILSGWKEIAKYLGRGIRTVQRWEVIGLPVRRVPQGSGAVFAVLEEIDVWLETCETQPTSIFPNHIVLPPPELATPLTPYYVNMCRSARG